ncbi:MAG: ABC transporter substrate-binding protein [Deinococcota bacterium]|jgi:NitT/TauT family transport system substrate-binding protein|nr:ABC transporter substrate-binding protein [Deinococcota bacterium]
MHRPLTTLLLLCCAALTQLGVAQRDATVGHINILPAALPLVAEAAGIYDELGLNANVIAFADGPSTAQALVAGQLDVAYVGYTLAYLWASQDAPVRILGRAANIDLVVMARQDAGIAELADLRGRTVGTPPNGTPPDVIFRGLVLPEAGLSGADIEQIQVPPPTLLPGLATGQFEAAVMPEPWGTIAKLQLEPVQVFDINDLLPEAVSVGIVFVTTQRTLEEKPELVEVLVEAHKRTVALSESDPETFNQLLADGFFPNGVETPSGTIEGRTVVDQAMARLSFGYELPEEAIEQMEALAAVLVELGIIEETIPVRGLIVQ